MDISRNRKRGDRIPLGSEPTHGGLIAFYLDEGRTLRFLSLPERPLLVFGVEIAIAGHVKLTPDFDVHTVEFEMRPFAGNARTALAFMDGDRDAALSNAVEKVVKDTATRLMARRTDELSEAWLTLADDYVLARMSYRQHVLDKEDDFGFDSAWKAASFREEQVERAERETDSIDQEAYAKAWFHSSRPGYVVVCDGRPVDRGEVRHRDDSGHRKGQRRAAAPRAGP